MQERLTCDIISEGGGQPQCQPSFLLLRRGCAGFDQILVNLGNGRYGIPFTIGVAPIHHHSSSETSLDLEWPARSTIIGNADTKKSTIQEASTIQEISTIQETSL